MCSLADGGRPGPRSRRLHLAAAHVECLFFFSLLFMYSLFILHLTSHNNQTKQMVHRADLTCDNRFSTEFYRLEINKIIIKNTFLFPPKNKIKNRKKTSIIFFIVIIIF